MKAGRKSHENLVISRTDSISLIFLSVSGDRFAQTRSVFFRAVSSSSESADAPVEKRATFSRTTVPDLLSKPTRKKS